MNKLTFLIILLFSFLSISAQTKKTVECYAIDEPLKIDGVLDENCYTNALPAKDFLQLQPYNGKPSYQATEVYFFYDQNAIYLGAMLYDNAPDSIYNFLTARDNIGMSDYFGVYFDPYNEGQLAFGFFITPAGVQTDIKAIKTSYDYEDGSWDAVWQSKTNITDKGWVIEMRIPYSALRFPLTDVHTWGLNMFRNIRRYNSNNSWNFIDRNVDGFIHQQGVMTGIKNIKPPVRLSFSPYLATYVEHSESSGETDFIYRGGLDLKYGINESYTLDMMLIPDFGQIQSDDKQLNLSPYELYYQERRQFFTEGVELFNRGEIFYSRRIGAYPKFTSTAYDNLKTNEIVEEMPSETQLVNATKISGRNKKGFAIGFLNAMSLNSYATIKDTITNSAREALVQPFTNYNVSVIDQSLKNNSYISLINTNMIVANNPFMANVTATEFQFRDKGLKYALSGQAGVSHRGAEDKETGWFTMLEFAKNRGKWQYGIEQSAISDDYNPNDMGYLQRNNRFDTELFLLFQKVEPFSIFRQMFTRTWYEQNRVMKPWDLNNHEAGIYTEWQFMNNYGVEARFTYVGNDRNYDEPRVEGRYFYKPETFNYNFFAHSDWTKKLHVYSYYGEYKRPERDQKGNWLGLGLGCQLGQKLSLSFEMAYEGEENDYGYVSKNDNEDSIHFARRNVATVENVLELSYTFNNELSLRLRGRHYWSGVENKQFYLLQNDGTLLPDAIYNENFDNNFNAFNIDMVLRWVFAPGSEMTFGWKNSIFDQDDKSISNYRKNIDIIWKSPQTNTLSFRILYYIDYNNLFNKQES
ncbi:DUF5916 domain-containing protein [Carboxylicivirga caseinilyticus]|uniref:DUF5916 domain-containing protein n=1 Tax=Carboxylicivirga caseinilyticus TaxID=3417572 RepID=UPI003D32E212|nr:carbohydrate binding family 9 domain-containing protein [Marinilabiliaceae bacterium A049]